MKPNLAYRASLWRRCRRPAALVVARTGRGRRLAGDPMRARNCCGVEQAYAVSFVGRQGEW
jgi:hypothetical protein